MVIHAKGIEWDTDGEKTNLPKDVMISVDADEYESNSTATADALSDAYGFSVISIAEEILPKKGRALTI